MTFSVELPKLLGSPAKSYNVDAAERKAFKAGANFQNASNGGHLPRPDTDRRLLDSSFHQPRAADRQPARFLDNTYTIEGSASRRSSVSSFDSLAGFDVADDARSSRSFISISDSLLSEFDHRLSALRRSSWDASDASDEVSTGSRRTSVWSADPRSSSAGDRADAWERTSIGSLSDAGSVFNDADGEERISVSSRDSMLWDTGHVMIELPRLGHRHGGSDASSIATDTSLHASKTEGGLASRIKSAFHRMFQGIYNLFRHGAEHGKAGTDVVDTAPRTYVSQYHHRFSPIATGPASGVPNGETGNARVIRQVPGAWCANDDALSDISADGYSEDAISDYRADFDGSVDSLDVYSGEFSLNDPAQTTPKRVGRTTEL